VRIGSALVGEILVGVPGPIRHDLRFSNLRVPFLVDSLGGPVPVALSADNRGTAHEVVNVEPFPSTLLLRGSTATLRTNWQPPSLVGLYTVKAGTLQATVILFPFRAIVAFLLLVVGLALLRKRFSFSFLW
jgi:hypothetical protein